MNTTELTYPVFEANQVLTNSHLNDMFEYLDEQQRLTRANLIGIGIACGLDVRFEAPDTVHLSKGCGVTSHGYLILEPEDVALVAVRPYKLPVELDYQPFVDPATNQQYDLWELFPDDEPGTQSLATSGLVLDDKAVVLLLELRKDGLRNCSPNSCDDRGAEVTTTVRRLLIDVADLDKVIVGATGVAAGLVATDLGAEVTERLNLPDLRMPRFDVPNSGPVAAEQVLAAFQATFRQNNLAQTTAHALTALYDAFKPLVVSEYATNPFTSFINASSFLDGSPITTTQVRFIQYYWDLFDDLLAGYDELRWKGVDLVCVCCPPEGLFPRHLMAGVLDPSKHSDPATYRHRFIPSPAVGDCEDRTREVLVLFRRLVAMVQSFTDSPSLPAPTNAGPDVQIRITPSTWGDAPLSVKAIPYYYEQGGTPPVYELWNPAKKARGRANQNLGYRADEYQPPAPAFVTDPLRFELEPHNFLRIEGHLGKNVHSVLNTLLSRKDSHRLPIEVIALRTGAFDENIEIDLSKEECRFEDLETLYDTLRVELICFLVKEIQYFYAIARPEAEPDDEPMIPSLELLKTWAPNYRVPPKSVGRIIEAVLTWRPGRPFVGAFGGNRDLNYHVFAIVGSMSELAARLSADIRGLDFTAFADRYRHLVEVAEQFEAARRDAAFDEPGLSDRLDDILFRCRLDPFEALAEEYKRRVRDVKQSQFLSHFLDQHPGVQHKAGVPLGGTFILVYHELPRRVLDTGQPELGMTDVEAGRPELDLTRFTTRFEIDEIKQRKVGEALARFQYKREFAEDRDVQNLYQLLTGRVLVPRVALSGIGEKIYLDAVADLADGAVIADFFLPYQCCSDCSPIQYTLPPVHLRVDARAACTNADGFSEVTLTTEGATGSVSVQVDGGSFEESTGTLLLQEGDHTIVVRDDTGAESSPVEITIPPQLTIGGTETRVDEPARTWQLVLSVAGGVPPYAADVGSIVDTTYTSPTLPLDEVLSVTITDAAGCTVAERFRSGVKPCDLPCDGAAVRSGHRFWIPEARPRFPLNDYQAEVRRFAITDADGTEVDLTAAVAAIVNRPNSIDSADFSGVIQRWLDRINRVVADAVGSDQWFALEYEAAPDDATTGTLWVDRLACIDFDFQLLVLFVQGRRERRLEVEYSSRGTLVSESSTDSKVLIPPFDGSTSNKCRPEEPPVPLCEGVELELVIEREGRFPDPVILTAVTPGPEQPVAFLWEVQDGIPHLAGGERVALRFEPVEPVEKLVRLTAFTERGCTAVLAQLINITDG